MGFEGSGGSSEKVVELSTGIPGTSISPASQSILHSLEQVLLSFLPLSSDLLLSEILEEVLPMLLFLVQSLLLRLFLFQDMFHGIARLLLLLGFLSCLLAFMLRLVLIMLCLLCFLHEELVFRCLSFLHIGLERSLLLFSINFLFLQLCRLFIKLVFVLLEFESLGQRHYPLLVLCLNDRLVGVAGHLLTNMIKL